MSLGRFRKDLLSIDSQIEKLQSREDSLGYGQKDFDHSELDQLLEDLTDYSYSTDDSALSNKLKSLQRDDDNYGYQERETLSEARARILRIVRVLETFGQKYLGDELSEISLKERLATPLKDIDQTGVKYSKKVFIVHGHDNAVVYRVKETLVKLGLSPIVLREQPNQGKTIIEKFETYTDVGFAVVLMTEDDMGGSLAEMENDQAKPRARQNVIMELGYFAALLSRSRICVLKSGSVEAPSDILGIVYTPIDAAEAWRLSLAQELKSAGYEVDLNRLV